MAGANANIEILVHYSAPSTAADDAYYRHLAATYLSFVPARQTSVTTSHDNNTSSNHPEPAPPPSSQLLPSVQAAPAGTPSSSLPASFASVIDNAGSPRIRVRPASPTSVPALSMPMSPLLPGQDSFSHVSDSQPSVQGNSYAAVGDVAIAEFGSPSRVSHFYHQQHQGTEDSPNASQKTVSSASSWVASTPLERQSQRVDQEAWEIIIPSSLPIPEFDRLSGSAVVTPSTAYAASSFAFSLPASQVSAQKAAETEDGSEESESCLPKLQNDQTLAKEVLDTFVHAHNSDPIAPVSQQPRQLQTSNSDIGTVQRQRPYRQELQQRLHTQQQAASTLQQRQFQEQFYHALEIYSPEPDISDRPVAPEELITPRLQQVAHDLDITARFKFTNLRKPRPLERGYWKIHTEHWPDALREAAWVFLANWIGAGFAGWGVRCYRDEARSYIRVYCWGIVIGPVYGVIYLASERQLKRERTEWLDADGNAAVIMEAREQTKPGNSSTVTYS